MCQMCCELLINFPKLIILIFVEVTDVKIKYTKIAHSYLKVLQTSTLSVELSCGEAQCSGALLCGSSHYLFTYSKQGSPSLFTLYFHHFNKFTDKIQWQERKEKTSRATVEPSDWCRNLPKSHGKCFMILSFFYQLLTIIFPIL